MARVRHWSARYAFDKARAAGFRLLHPGAPWLTAETVRILAEWLRPVFRGWEWGAGRSTVWFAQRVRELVSIEHNPGWGERVSGQLRRRALAHVDLRLIPADTRAYENAIRDEADGSLDFVLVDGLSAKRDACAWAAIPKVRVAGFLIVDDAQRYWPSRSRAPGALPAGALPATPLWAQVHDALAGWPKLVTSDGMRDTIMWRRPER